MEIRSDVLDFSLPLRGNGPRSATKTLVFPRSVTSAVAGLTGYLAEFTPRDDHHVGMIDVRLTTSITATAVTVTGFFGVRDWSGDWDDNYDGLINFTVLAELEDITLPPPRGDLQITGLEYNQATQFYRASRFLDLAEVQPDNSVFLIASKNTGVRVYVDYDAASGLPVISQLSGELVVSSGAGNTTLTPINSAIVPKRDSAINQALSTDTLNFMIPASLCTGTVTVSCRVFDQANPVSGSGLFTQTLVFTTIDTLSVSLVGVQTLNPPAPAPAMAQIAGAFSLLESVYPRGTVQFTGFNTITLTPQITGSMATSGCGDAWSQLLDSLRDLRGGSTDLFFGGLPPGIFTSGVVGCSPVGERVAAAFIDILPTVPHECGHALGLQHDPCRGCNFPVQDPNNDYPTYGSFPADSIGVFGYDPVNDIVFSPTSATDFMTAVVPPTAWISPYTYKLLLPVGETGPAPAGAMSLYRGEHEMLFLGLEIARDRSVVRRPSFHHPALIQGVNRPPLSFTWELLDAKRRVLDCGPLHGDCDTCGCGGHGSSCSCFPKRTRDIIPYPKDAAFFAVYDGERQIHVEEIPRPPQVHIDGQQPEKDGVAVAWTASPDAVAFLVHYRDEKAQCWRGLTPRVTETRVVVPWAVVRRVGKLPIRVLATSGIATGYAGTVLETDDEGKPDVTVTMLGLEPLTEKPRSMQPVVRAIAIDAGGAEAPGGQITWFDSAGRTLSRGAEVDLRQLPDGQHLIRAVVRGHGGRLTGKSWAIERKGRQFLLHAVVCDPPRPPPSPPHQHPHPTPEPCTE
jgi:hypothetical protein